MKYQEYLWVAQLVRKLALVLAFGLATLYNEKVVFAQILIEILNLVASSVMLGVGVAPLALLDLTVAGLINARLDSAAAMIGAVLVTSCYLLLAFFNCYSARLPK